MLNDKGRLKGYLLIPMLALILMTSGCATIISSPTQVTEKSQGFPSIRMDSQEMQCSGGIGNYIQRTDNGDLLNFQQLFIKNLSRLIPVEQGAPLTLANLKIEIIYDRPSVGEIITGFFSTIVPFLPLKTFNRTTTCVASYTIRDSSGFEVMSSSVGESVKGSYWGWSITRLASVSKLQKNSVSLLAKDAGRMVASDLFSKAATGQLRMTGHRAIRVDVPVINKREQLQERISAAVKEDVNLAVPVQAAVPSESPESSMGRSDDVVIRLKRLREARDAGLLTQEEYETRRKAVIDSQ